MPLRIGLCGLGSAARRGHVPALARPVEEGRAAVVAVCDPHPERRDAAIARLPGARAFPHLEALLDSCELDLVVIATPPSSHLAAIAAAAGRGHDVLCEKPLGLTAGEMWELRDIIRARPGGLVATVLQYTHAPTWAVVRGAVREALGRGDPFTLTIEVERPGTDPLSADGWRSSRALEGGIIGDHGAHQLSLCRSACDEAHLESCELGGPPGAQTAELRLAVGSGRARLHLSYAGRRRSNLIHLESPGAGTITWRDSQLLIRDGDGRAAAPRPVEALSDRSLVNALYAPLYEDLLARIGDSRWRRERTAETFAVARLVCAALGSRERAPTGAL